MTPVPGRQAFLTDLLQHNLIRAKPKNRHRPSAERLLSPPPRSENYKLFSNSKLANQGFRLSVPKGSVSYENVGLCQFRE